MNIRRFRSRVGEVAVGSVILGLMSFYWALAFLHHDEFESLTVWQLSVVGFAFLVAVSWAFRLMVGPAHYHDDYLVEGPVAWRADALRNPPAKLRVAHVDLDTGKVVKREELTPRQVRRRFFR